MLGGRWRDAVDANPENGVAGNVDDLIKHTVYLTVLSALGEGARVRECHAGRGVYAVPVGDDRRTKIDRLGDTSLGRAQRAALARIGASPEEMYAGSALLCALAVDDYEGYEWDPATRAILRAVLDASDRRVLIPGAGSERFDGETHIADGIGASRGADVLLFDPFGIWDRDKHANRRARYLRIADGLAEHPDPPAWLVYFTWRHASAREASVIGGYRDMERRMAQNVIELSWTHRVPCALWIGGRQMDVATRLERELAALDAAVGIPEVTIRWIPKSRDSDSTSAPRDRTGRCPTGPSPV